MEKEKNIKAIQPNGDGTRNHKWAAVVPLVGGMAIGNHMATGTKPEFMLSFPAFMSNDQHIRNYWPDVPYSLIDPESGKLFDDDIQEEYGCYKCHKEKLQEKFDGIDFVSSVPPCAGLSMLNTSQKKDSATARGSDAAQNEWMYKSSRFILENIQPRVLFGENAPGLFTSTGEGVVEKLKVIAKETGYSFSMYKTNTIHHGIPQKRERTFYFFWKDSKPPIMEHYRREYKVLEEYLREIPENTSMSDQYPGIKTLKGNPWVEFIKYREGKKWRESLADYKTAIQYVDSHNAFDEALEWANNVYKPEVEKRKDKFIRIVEHVKYKKSIGKGWWDSSPHFFNEHVNAVIGKNITVTVHPEEERGLNLREVAHLMGLPHDFEISDVKYNNHLAQNVPTCTARDMTIEVMKYLDNKLPISTEEFFKQNNAKKGVKVDETKAVKLF